MKEFYVYLYLDPRKPGKFCYGRYRFNFEPFYVGKGSNGRAFFLNGRKKFVANKLRKVKEPIIIFYKSNLSEERAFELEKKLIARIGRKGIGPLCNLTNGGEGTTGHVHICSEEHKRKLSEYWRGKKRIPHSEETKRKLSEVQKGRKRKPHSEETKKKIGDANRGHKHSEEFRKRISERRKGIKLSEEHKEKIRKSMKGKNTKRS